MDEPSVMGTENALMAAALTPGATRICNAASEPHVQDLARLLAKMGAPVEGIGSNMMTVHGQKTLGGVEHSLHHVVVGERRHVASVGGEVQRRRLHLRARHQHA